MRRKEIQRYLLTGWMILLVVVRVDVSGATLTVSAEHQAIIIDHNCVDISEIPQELLDRAASLRILMRHASVGTGINWGLDCMAGAKPTNPPCSGFTPGKYDRSNWGLEQRAGNWQSKMDDLVAQVATRTDDFDIFMTKLCYIDALGDNHPDWDYCRDTMEHLEADYPDKRVIWWTIPLTRDGMPGTDWFNEKVRTYCAANNKILFDIADIECHDLSGTRLTNAQGNETISAEYTNEIHAGHLNKEGRIRVATAMWHLMTQLATNHQTIQSAINAASDGDTVLVADGTYTGPGNRDIDFKGKAITLRSENGPDNCIIDCNASYQNQHRGFYFHAGEGPDSIVSGLTITNGYVCAANGGGILCEGASPTIEGCVISNNEVEAPGGLASDAYGGGIYCGENCAINIMNCRIIENQASMSLGGWSYAFGGGLYCLDSSNVTMKHCTIEGNQDGGIGGGLYNTGGNLMLSECVFKNNITGFHTDGGTVVASHCSFTVNFGGVIVYGGSEVTLCNCTVADNFGGVGVGNGRVSLEGCIVWGNGGYEIVVEKGTASATHCDIRGGFPGEGNIDIDPHFTQNGYWDINDTRPDTRDDSWANGDYQLKSQAGRWDPNSGSWVRDDVTSPCIDAGDPMTPIGHEPFPNAGLINMGAYGGTAEASKSYFDAPVCQTIIAGDINGDCLVDFKDFRLLALRWLEDNNP